MKIRIQHTTRYVYEGPVSFSDHQLRVCPRSDHALQLHNFSIKTHPESSRRWVRDLHNNPVLICNFGLQESRELVFEVMLEVEVQEENPFNFVLDSHALAYPLKYNKAELAAIFTSRRRVVGRMGVMKGSTARRGLCMPGWGSTCPVLAGRDLIRPMGFLRTDILFRVPLLWSPMRLRPQADAISPSSQRARTWSSL